MRGRVWAVRDWPTVTNTDQRWPRNPSSEAFYVSSVQVALRAPHFLRNKKQEWEEYRSEVTAFELKNLLPVL